MSGSGHSRPSRPRSTLVLVRCYSKRGQPRAPAMHCFNCCSLSFGQPAARGFQFQTKNLATLDADHVGGSRHDAHCLENGRLDSRAIAAVRRVEGKTFLAPRRRKCANTAFWISCSGLFPAAIGTSDRLTSPPHFDFAHDGKKVDIGKKPFIHRHFQAASLRRLTSPP